MKSYIKTIIFIILIFGMTAITLIKPQKKFSPNENRYLAQRPSFSASSFFDGSFTRDYESYVTDQFPNRDQWLAMKVDTERLLQKKDINGVYFGRDGSLIAKHPQKDFDEELISKNLRRLKKFIANTKSEIKNPVNVMLVPTSSQVLKEQLPPYAMEYDQSKLMEQAKQAMKDESASFIDATPVLEKHKDEYIYYRTDHHWTTLGAYYAYCDWAKKNGFTPVNEKNYNQTITTNSFLGTTYSKVNVPVKEDSIHLYEFPKLSCKVTFDQNNKMKSMYDKNYLNEKDKYSVFFGGNHAYTSVDTNVRNGRKLLVIKDSFAHSFVPFAANHYEKVVMLDYRYFNGSTQKVIKDEKITDILVLYNTVNFAQDKYFGKIMN